MLKFILALCSLLFCAQTYAYTVNTVFNTEHFAIKEVILEPNERFDADLQYLIQRDMQTQNRLEKKYQTSTVVFPQGSYGLKSGNINSKMLGVLTISNYGTGNDQIVFNTNANYTTYAGLYISYDLLVYMLDNKNLNHLIAELVKLPLVLTDIPVTSFAIDYKNSKYITSRSKAFILDIEIIDSLFYKAKELAKLNNKCKVSVLAFVDRAVADFPVFLSLHGALNNMDCGNNDVAEQITSFSAQ